jgi:tRNA (cmo5U34)-methyltransferase|tara:strand:- start:25 stop:741 length:717 start_codon:yes stop_codon:yes gene_type:complete
MKRIKIDNNIFQNKQEWSFSKKIAPKFDAHIKKSIPFYKEYQWLCSEISDYFVKDNSIIYDIGCSTGSFTKQLSQRHKNKNKIKFYGIDVVPEMIKFAKKNNPQKNITYLLKDINRYKFFKSDFIISFYTVQFIKQKYRQRIINNIFKSLNWGGGFFFAEKVRSYDARTQDMNNEVYKEWKAHQGFSDEEINSKTKSLKGILDPFSSKGNLEMLKRAGFKDFLVIAKFVSFEIVLAIK